MSQIIINNHAISYSNIGSGQTILFIHGWSDSKETFSLLVGVLRNKYRCIALDLPNFGKSDENTECINLEQFSDLLKLFIEKNNIQNYSIAGHSMGGQIAIYATAYGIVKPKNLFIIAGAGVRNNQARKKKILMIASKIFKFITPNNIKNFGYKLIGSDYSADLSPVHKKIIKNLLSHDVSDIAKNINVPVLLIYGDKDTSTPVEFGQKFQKEINNSTLKIIKDADHYLHKNNYKQVADLIDGKNT